MSKKLAQYILTVSSPRGGFFTYRLDVKAGHDGKRLLLVEWLIANRAAGYIGSLNRGAQKWWEALQVSHASMGASKEAIDVARWALFHRLPYFKDYRPATLPDGYRIKLYQIAGSDLESYEPDPSPQHLAGSR